MDATSLTEAIKTALTVAGQGVTFIGDNPLCMLFIGFAALRSGIGLFGTAKSAAM